VVAGDPVAAAATAISAAAAAACLAAKSTPATTTWRQAAREAAAEAEASNATYLGTQSWTSNVRINCALGSAQSLPAKRYGVRLKRLPYVDEAACQERLYNLMDRLPLQTSDNSQQQQQGEQESKKERKRKKEKNKGKTGRGGREVAGAEWWWQE